MYWFHFWAREMKVDMSSQVPVYTEISRKASRDIQLTNNVDQNHLKYKLWTLSRHFWQKYDFRSIMCLKTRKIHNWGTSVGFRGTYMIKHPPKLGYCASFEGSYIFPRALELDIFNFLLFGSPLSGRGKEWTGSRSSRLRIFGLLLVNSHQRIPPTEKSNEKCLPKSADFGTFCALAPWLMHSGTPEVPYLWSQKDLRNLSISEVRLFTYHLKR